MRDKEVSDLGRVETRVADVVQEHSDGPLPPSIDQHHTAARCDKEDADGLKAARIHIVKEFEGRLLLPAWRRPPLGRKHDEVPVDVPGAP